MRLAESDHVGGDQRGGVGGEVGDHLGDLTRGGDVDERGACGDVLADGAGDPAGVGDLRILAFIKSNSSRVSRPFSIMSASLASSSTGDTETGRASGAGLAAASPARTPE
jgi:hypothetical protein